MKINLPDLGDLLLAIALLFTVLIVICEFAERRRDSKREQRQLEAIEREYQAYFGVGRF
jgi:hypothetical protein